MVLAYIQPQFPANDFDCSTTGTQAPGNGFTQKLQGEKKISTVTGPGKRKESQKQQNTRASCSTSTRIPKCSSRFPHLHL